MTVNISKPSLNLREELAALRNQGGYSEQAFHKNGLVTNGTFDSDTSGWAASIATLSVVSNAIRVTSNTTYGYAHQTLTTIVGKSYTISHTAVGGNTFGSFVRIGTSLGGSQLYGGTHSAAGTITSTFVATSTTSYLILMNGGVSGGYTDFDNISVYETDGTNVIHTTPAGWLPKDVFVNGLLKREGSGWDYTVHTDGTKHWIKPTVAPSATTTTTILGVRA